MYTSSELKFATNLRAVYDLRFPGVEHLADLPGHESLAGAGRAVQQDPLDVLAAELLHDLRWEDTGGERSSEERSVICYDGQLICSVVVLFWLRESKMDI